MASGENRIKRGVIAFLDFLGWKGIWLGDYKKQSVSTAKMSSVSEFDYTALDNLDDLITTAEQLFLGKTKGLESKFISISDTIALFTSCDSKDYYKTLKLYSDVCGNILDLAAGYGFALRGAITMGEYATLKNIMVGPCVDECASWYEQANWLGVIFAPSAQFIIDEKRRETELDQDNEDINQKRKLIWRDDNIVEYKEISLKNGFKGLKYCVVWGKNNEILNKPLENTLSLTIDVAQKYINTQNYLYEIRPEKMEHNLDDHK